MVWRWLALGSLSLACARAAAAPAPDARAAVQRALPFLERDGVAWMAGKTAVQGGSACVSCHHVGYALWSHREAKRAGLVIPAERIEPLDRQAHASFAADPDEPRPMSQSALILGRGDDAPARADLDRLIAEQEKDGHWAASGQFPAQNRPVAESDATATMWALVALGSGGAPAARKKALDWLKASPPGETTEWLALRLLVPTSDGKESLPQLLQAQHPDGGWGWKAGGPSNAYSTGQALYALAIAAPAEPAVARAAAYLAATQAADGTWTTPSKLISKKSHFKRDYIYQYWGTAWAAIGLARSLERVPVSASAR